MGRSDRVTLDLASLLTADEAIQHALAAYYATVRFQTLPQWQGEVDVPMFAEQVAAEFANRVTHQVTARSGTMFGFNVGGYDVPNDSASGTRV